MLEVVIGHAPLHPMQHEPVNRQVADCARGGLPEWVGDAKPVRRHAADGTDKECDQRKP